MEGEGEAAAVELIAEFIVLSNGAFA